jgi:hypothetical protein
MQGMSIALASLAVAVLAVPRLTVRLDVGEVPAPHSAVVAGALAEAARIWAPYGIAVVRADGGKPCGPSAPETVAITVKLVDADPPARERLWSSPLGAITFAADGEPEPLLLVYLTAIKRLGAQARVLPLEESEWPIARRVSVTGIIVGRVLAHEIGHYVLKSPRHAASGLMRSNQLVVDLAGRHADLFTLAADDRERLERLLTPGELAWAAKAGAVSEPAAPPPDGGAPANRTTARR